MSWSISFIGKSENIAEALKEASAKLDGESKKEFDDALPHLVGLVQQNFSKDGSSVLQIIASGHGFDSYRMCNVSIQPLSGYLV